MKTSKTVATIATLLISSAAHAGFVIIPSRCVPDNLPQWNHDLNPNQFDVNTPSANTARGRNAWFLVCDPMRYETINPAYNKIGINAEFDPTTKTHTRWYPTFGVITGIAPDGSLLFTRPGISPAAPNTPWIAPTVAPSSIGDAACKLPGQYEFVGVCASGCVTPEQQVTTAQGDQAIAPFEQTSSPSVMVPGVSKDGQLQYDAMPVRAFIKDLNDAEQKLVIIRTQSGGTLRVTTDHPLLVGDFTMKHAEKLVVGDSLIRNDGKADPITELHTEQYFGKVHNLIVETQNMQKSLLVVQGYISGDKKYQDMTISDMNRRFLRDLVRD